VGARLARKPNNFADALLGKLTDPVTGQQPKRMLHN